MHPHLAATGNEYGGRTLKRSLRAKGIFYREGAEFGFLGVFEKNEEWPKMDQTGLIINHKSSHVVMYWWLGHNDPY